MFLNDCFQNLLILLLILLSCISFQPFLYAFLPFVCFLLLIFGNSPELCVCTPFEKDFLKLNLKMKKIFLTRIFLMKNFFLNQMKSRMMMIFLTCLIGYQPGSVPNSTVLGNYSNLQFV
ncbi:hypothetical protein GVAV_003117 [Gurleya vavrai]